MALASYQVHGDQIKTQTQLNGQGTGVEDVHVIPYTITSGPAQGARRQVKVSNMNYSPGPVQGAIEADVDITHKIASLGQTAPGR